MGTQNSSKYIFFFAETTAAGIYEPRHQYTVFENRAIAIPQQAEWYDSRGWGGELRTRGRTVEAPGAYPRHLSLILLDALRTTNYRERFGSEQVNTRALRIKEKTYR